MTVRFSALLLGGSILTACAGVADDDATADVNAADTVDSPALELSCESESTPFSFAVGAKLGGAGVEGRLTAENGGITLFTCHPLPSLLASAVLSCTERTQSIHPGHYRVNVTKANDAFTATLTENATDPKVTLPCTSRAPLAAPMPAPTYDAVKTILGTSCSRCHQREFDSLSKVKQKRSRMVGMVSSGTMPRGQPTFRDTPDGQTLIAFLLGSAELK